MAKQLKLTEAIAKWGRAKARPHEIYSGFLEWRREINFKIPCNLHPHESIITNWHISEEMIQTKVFTYTRSLSFIDTQKELRDACHEISQFKEITVDTEMNGEGYHMLVSLIQISTAQKDYVFDALKLFAVIKDTLGPILENPTILKVFHSTNDLIPIQRNFEIYTVGIIDAQEAYELIRGVKNIGFPLMVKEYLDKEVDKTPQCFDYRIRPLPEEILEYARNDTSYLFQCWLHIKQSLSLLEHEPFHSSKAASLKLVAHTKIQNAENAWQSYVDQNKNKTWFHVFNTYGQKRLFIELFNTRDMEAKSRDINPGKLVKHESLQLLTRTMPITVQKIKTLRLGYWVNEAFIRKLTDVIIKHKDEMFSNVNATPITTLNRTRPCINRIEADALAISDEELDCWDNASDCESGDFFNAEVTKSVSREPVMAPLSPMQIDKIAVSSNAINAEVGIGDDASRNMVNDDYEGKPNDQKNKRARKHFRYRQNRIREGKSIRKPAKRSSGVAKRVKAVFTAALRYNVNEEEILAHLGKLPNSLKKKE